MPQLNENSVLERAKKIRLLLLDVDGVLTDGRIIIGSYGDEIKNFDVNDGLGIFLIKKGGLRSAIITAKNSRAVKIRARHLKIDKVYENHYKIKSLNDIKKRFKVKEEEICFVGDDLIDLSILKRVGLACAVPNACKEVKDAAHYVTRLPGGKGAVREICELILKAQGKWDELVKAYSE
ncbi:MAG: HAD hydrolase family protein [Candidatus Omnitrophica bacterium]|nr:HAD hydrolase family protein [Candidatus Omnitrophota bacterium]